MSTAPHRDAPSAGATCEYLDTPQAAALLGLKPTTLRLARHGHRVCGAIGPRWLKLGRNVRYRRADLLAWAEAVAIEHAPSPAATTGQ